MLVSSHTTLKADLIYGFQNEQIILPKLRAHFQDETINKTPEKYCPYDYVGSNGFRYELKSRRIPMNLYSTTLFPCHKVSNTDTQYFIIKFTDADAFIKYDRDRFNTYELKMLMDTRAGKQGVQALHYCIPVTDLTTF